MNRTPFSDIPIIHSELLSRYPEIRFAMSSRIGGVSSEPYGMNLSFHVGDHQENVRRNREFFLGKLNIKVDQLANPQQVHGDTVRRVRKPGIYESCDALISNTHEVYLVVSIADCLPIFLFDPETKSIAAVHAGWRGSELRILSKVIEAMKNEFGTKAQNLIAYIGPAAGVCCYEVGQEVARLFSKKYLNQTTMNKIHLDLKLMNKDLLREFDIPESHIEVSEECTICNSIMFHSYRRDGQRSGRMMALIGLRAGEIK
ncbi:MAG: peptidoglycan editing factor PgeF [Ignavibacteriae bacterium]|nr:peptidoglycan editing factor PgeF [Ignavibacteriota bacterium]